MAESPIVLPPQGGPLWLRHCPSISSKKLNGAGSVDQMRRRGLNPSGKTIAAKYCVRSVTPPPGSDQQFPAAPPLISRTYAAGAAMHGATKSNKSEIKETIVAGISP